MASRRYALAGLLLAACFASTGDVTAQATSDDGWNESGAIDLIRRGVERRSSEVRDTSLQTYSARGDGYVYFLLDAPGAGQETLVRTDQVAVDVHWRSPDQVRQRIVGMREERELPITGLYYYIDRLTVVQDNYGPSIVIADGDNVNDVPHPIGTDGETFYDYRLADSLTLRLSGVVDPVRVHEVQVRPKDPGRAAIIGSVFLEATTGALVRMSFTFTATAYVDPRLDFINVTLENGLWGGRYWLPHEQRLEIRREMPELDLPFGTVIRTHMRIGGYRFNEPVPDWLFSSRLSISMAPPAERDTFEFSQPIDAGWRLQERSSPVEVDQIRQAARQLARDQMLTGLPAGRLSIASASDVFRYNRAEGAVVGIGVSARPAPDISLSVNGGWAFGARHPKLGVQLMRAGRVEIESQAYFNNDRDIGGIRPASGAMNTLSSVLLGRDWLDPYFASGGAVSLQIPSGSGFQVGLSSRLEHQRAASLTTTFSVFGADAEARSIREIDRGTHLSGTLSMSSGTRNERMGWWGEADFTIGRLAGTDRNFDFGRSDFEGGIRHSWSQRRAFVSLGGGAGVLVGEPPQQEIYLVGGRGSLPGYGHRVFGGDRYLLLNGEASADLDHPWLRARGFGSVGWTGLGDAGGRTAEIQELRASGGLRTSVGGGIGVFYDLLRIDVARGLGRDGRTQLIVEFPTNFWDFL
jgi:hypothetical protein